MKKLLYTILSCILLFLLWSNKVSATHAAGGELLYEHVSGNTYKFVFKFYRDCSGINAPMSHRMCFVNTCNVTSPQTVFLQRTSGPVLVNGDCPNISTNCTTPNGLPSYEEYIYEANVTLSETCNSWRFWVNHNARNPMNFLNGTNLYVETSFDNTISNLDNSPTFNRLPVPYCCVNTPFVYDNGASDVDGDSLVYESIMPRTHPVFNNCPSSPPQLCTYPTYTPALNFATNPLPCNNSFVLNPSTGLFSMTPTAQGKGVIAIKVSQYRNGQLIGYIVRDIQTIVLSCNIATPTLAIDTNSLVQCNYRNDTIRACAENNFTFCFNTVSSDPSSLISIQSNINSFSTPSSLNHQNMNTDSVNSCFNWTPSLADTGWHYLNLSVTDSICRPIGVLNTDTFTRIIPIYIMPKMKVTENQTVCEPNTYMGYSQTGTYIDTFINQWGCDSIRTLNLTVTPRNYTTINMSICSPGSFMGYSQSGTYVDTFTNTQGCDSIRTLNLIVNNQYTYTINQTICWNDSFLGYSQTGTYTDTFSNIQGCDSIRTLNLVVTPLAIDTINQTICEPASYLGYSQTGTYIDTLTTTAGCDSVRVLNLVVTPRSYFALNYTICAPDTFMGYWQSGVYIDTFTSASGCDSIHTLVLTVNASSPQTILNEIICEPNTFLGYSQTGTYIDTFTNIVGCDSVRIINLTVHSKSYDTIQQTICSPNSYIGYSQSGTYVDTLVNAAGCDSIRTLILTVLPTTDTIITESICEPNSYLGYNQTGTYIDTLIGSNGCDSIRTLNLTVIPRTYSSFQEVICEPNTFFGYSQSGTYTDTFINAAGCDSIRTLNLIVHPIQYTTISTSICFPNSYMGYSQSGTYVDTFSTIQGCDSIRTLQLTVLQLSDTTITQSICEPNSFLGYTQSGTYIDTFTNTVGCDSIRTLHLTVIPRTYSTIQQSICEPNNFLGYTQSGIYVDTLVNAAGCDSIRTLNLIVYPILNTNVTMTICEPDSFMGYNQSGTYVDTFASIQGCDSIRTLVLTVLPITYLTIDTVLCYPSSIFGYSMSGTYYDTLSNAVGCELRRTLNLIVQQPYLFDTTVVLCQGEEYLINGRQLRSEGVYTDSLTTIHGCDSIIITRVVVIDIPQPDLGPNQEICNGDSVRLMPGGFDNYLWNTGDTNQVKFVGQSGQYIVRVQNNGNRCFKHDTIEIVVHDFPELSIRVVDDPPCMGSYVTLEGSGAANYSWYLPPKFRAPYGTTSSIEWFAGKERQEIMLIGWDLEQCKDTAEASLLATDCCGNIVIPNAFTPNGDGLNDKYGLVLNPQIEKLEFSIFNRWGQLIFRTNSFYEKWDGTYKGEPCEMGTYYYIIRSKCYTQQEPKMYKGDVHLVK